MTTHLLASDLSTLIQDVKRKYPDIKTAAEKSLADLKSLPNTSDLQLAADLRRRPEFVRPFLLACKSGNSKHATLSIVNLQRLISMKCLPQEKVEDVLNSLRECTGLGSDVQLRILQVMPSLFQQYGDQVIDSRLTTALQICFLLQASKNAVISNTGAATLQQVVSVVFGRIGSEKLRSEAASPETTQISWQAELDCHQVLQDLCFIAEGKQVRSLDNTTVSKDFAFELIATILLNYTSVIPKYSNFIDILRQQLLPLIIRIVSSGAAFNSTVRALRLIPPITEGFLEALPTELEMLLSMLSYMLEPEAAPSWKRIVCMETIREMYKESSVVRRAYILFDEQEGHKAVVQEQLNMISRLASEKPAVIGLGKISSLPSAIEESGEDLDGLSALQADPLTATTGVSLTEKTSTISGIGLAVSTMKVSLIDQLDKFDPPSVPPSYIYATALTTTNNLCESMARFILPFAMSRTPRSSSRPPDSKNQKTSDIEEEDSHLPVNPLELKQHGDYQQILASGEMLQRCWSALLSTYSTFFQAALDPEFYHGAIRAFQKIIQVATLLRLSAPRDAFLSLLAKQSLPLESAEPSRLPSHDMSNGKDRRVKVHSPVPRFSPRNLLCLRALLNLGIALGTVLDDAWKIIMNTLQQADIIIGYISVDRTLSKGGPAIIAPATGAGGEVSKDFGNEISAVRSAASRMLTSSCDLPREQFLKFLFLLSSLMGCTASGAIDVQNPVSPSSTRRDQKTHTSEPNESLYDLRADVFVIDAFSQVSDCNKSRFCRDKPENTGWSFIVKTLSRLVSDSDLDAEVRIAAAESICKTVTGALAASEIDIKSHYLLPYGLTVLDSLAKSVIMAKRGSHLRVAAEEIHTMSLQTLKNCLDLHGHSIEDGWQHVCQLMLSAFNQTEQSSSQPSSRNSLNFRQARPLSSKILRAAFSSLQTVCTEVIDTLPYSCLSDILRAVYLCCSQTLDLNISLTATSLYQNISDHIWARRNSLDIKEASVSLETTDLSPDRLWIQTLTALCEASAVPQADIRNNAVYACFRILSGAGERLQPEHWDFCMRFVVIKLYSLNQASRESCSETESDKAIIAYDETASIIHRGSCALLEEHFLTMIRSEGFSQTWSNFISQISQLLSRGSLALSNSIYSDFSRFIDSFEDDSSDFAPFATTLWKMWESSSPHQHKRLDRPANTDNQQALLSYITFASNLYKVSSGLTRVEIASTVLRCIEKSVTYSTPTALVNDLARITPLQEDCKKLLETIYNSTQVSVTPAFLKSTASLSMLPLTVKREDEGSRGPTFVAFAKAVLEQMGRCISERSEICDLHKNPETIHCLESYQSLISHRAAWQREGQTIDIWKDAIKGAVASAASLTILSSRNGFPSGSLPTWKAILRIFDSILNFGESQGKSHETKDDFEFEIEAFRKLYKLLVPNLGSSQIPEEVQRKFAEILFLRSLIHEPHPDDSLDPFEKRDWPGQQRIGRVGEVVPSKRSKLCYLIIDTMYDMVSRAKETSDFNRLAHAIAPYLLLRVELVLKAYISDQPLRGRMPCPLSQKIEILHLLHNSVRIADVQGNSNASTEAASTEAGSTSLVVAHKNALIKLAVSATRVTKYDENLRESLISTIEN